MGWLNQSSQLGRNKEKNCCRGLNENGPRRLIYFNTWSPVGGNVLGHLVGGGVSPGTVFKDSKTYT